MHLETINIWCLNNVGNVFEMQGKQTTFLHFLLYNLIAITIRQAGTAMCQWLRRRTCAQQAWVELLLDPSE